MARFSGVPAVPMENIEPALARILYALKENVELLTNQRGEFDGASAAVISGDVSVSTVDATYQALSARGLGVDVSGTSVPLLTDYVNLLQDFQLLAYDVAVLRSAVNNLIAQLRADI